MDNFAGYANRPFRFLGRYLKQRWLPHTLIVATIVLAVLCSVGTQYPLNSLVGSLTFGVTHGVWLAFCLLVSLIAADNVLWRVAGWIASTTFVKVTGDLRRDLFRHLTGQAPSYFTEQMPGTVASRITATSNA